MKRMGFILMAAALCIGCAGGAANYGAGSSSSVSVPDELDEAIRDASDYLNNNIPAGSKIVILNIQSGSVPLSNYVTDELIANAVNDKNFSVVVDRQQLDAIRAEQNFQMSGEVADDQARAIGRFFGAEIIVSGTVSVLGERYRMAVRALEVETARVQGQYNRNIAAGATITALMRSGGGPVIGTQPAASGTGGTTAGGTSSGGTAATPPPITGTMVPGSSLAEKLAWLQRSADSHNTYIVEVTADENIAPHTFEYRGAINITVVLRGDNVNRTIRLRSNGTMFTVSENVTLVLDNNITLQGHNGNDGAMVYVRRDGTLRMNAGSAITGNISSYGDGGGVHIMRGTFEMTGGTISGNTAPRGGGVYVDLATFTMSGGTISGNTAMYGGGVFLLGGTCTFTMRGGTITGNTSREYGGGVLAGEGAFTKTGGTITGYSSDPANGNVVSDGSVLARRGHAVYVNANRRKETTAGPGVNLSTGYDRPTSGAWD